MYPFIEIITKQKKDLFKMEKTQIKRLTIPVQCTKEQLLNNCRCYTKCNCNDIPTQFWNNQIKKVLETQFGGMQDPNCPLYFTNVSCDKYILEMTAESHDYEIKWNFLWTQSYVHQDVNFMYTLSQLKRDISREIYILKLENTSFLQKEKPFTKFDLNERKLGSYSGFDSCYIEKDHSDSIFGRVNFSTSEYPDSYIFSYNARINSGLTVVAAISFKPTITN